MRAMHHYDEPACALQVIDFVGSEDESEGDGRDDDFAEGSDDEWAGSLFEEVFEVGAEAYSGEGQEEGPAAEVA